MATRHNGSGSGHGAYDRYTYADLQKMLEMDDVQSAVSVQSKQRARQKKARQRNRGFVLSLILVVLISAALLFGMADRIPLTRGSDVAEQTTAASLFNEETTVDRLNDEETTAGLRADETTTADRRIDEETTADPGKQKKAPTEDPRAADKTHYEYYYNLLTDAEKRVYDEVFNAVNKEEQTFTVSYLESDDFCRVFRALQYDHPELYWFINCTFWTYVDTKIDVTLNCYDSLWKYTSSVHRDRQALEAAVAEVVEQANRYATDYEKIKYVHDYLIKTADYAYDELDRFKKNGECGTIYTAYGCLVKHRCVCAGYAKSFQIIMDRLGINCTYIAGDTEGGSHAWNYVELDGQGYYIDVTWDDPSSAGKDPSKWVDPSGENATYNFFCVSTNTMLQTRTFGLKDTTEDDRFEYIYCPFDYSKKYAW